MLFLPFMLIPFSTLSKTLVRELFVLLILIIFEFVIITY